MKVSPGTKYLTQRVYLYPRTEVPDPMGTFVPVLPTKKKDPCLLSLQTTMIFSQFTYKILPVYGKICSSYV